MDAKEKSNNGISDGNVLWNYIGVFLPRSTLLDPNQLQKTGSKAVYFKKSLAQLVKDNYGIKI